MTNIKKAVMVIVLVSGSMPAFAGYFTRLSTRIISGGAAFGFSAYGIPKTYEAYKQEQEALKALAQKMQGFAQQIARSEDRIQEAQFVSKNVAESLKTAPKETLTAGSLTLASLVTGTLVLPRLLLAPAFAALGITSHNAINEMNQTTITKIAKVVDEQTAEYRKKITENQKWFNRDVKKETEEKAVQQMQEVIGDSITKQD